MFRVASPRWDRQLPGLFELFSILARDAENTLYGLYINTVFFYLPVATFYLRYIVCFSTLLRVLSILLCLLYCILQFVICIHAHDVYRMYYHILILHRHSLPERPTTFHNIFNTTSEAPVDVEYMDEAILFKSG